MIDATHHRPWLPLLLLALLWSGQIRGDTVPLVTFGPQATPAKGDDDFVETVQLRVPRDIQGPLHVRILDPDVGGMMDEPNGPWNTHTRFALFGGGGAKLADASFAESPELDGRWHTLARISPDQGELEGDDFVFRLVVTGLEGDDGNLYELAISRSPDTNSPVPGAVWLNERPTLSVPPGQDRHAEARFQIPPGTRSLSIRVFDLDRARIWLERPFAEPRALTDSGDGQWSEERIPLDPASEPLAAAILIQGGRKLLNDLVLAAADQDGRPLAIELPVRLEPRSVPPRPLFSHEWSGCRSLALDASASEGVDDDLVAYHWDFGDGSSGQGTRVEHEYAEPGTYRVVLTVVDDSGRPVDRARLERPLKINRLPDAVPGPGRTVSPGERLDFNAEGSRDLDGRLTAYRWDFGDGQGAEGARVSHAYTDPGRYSVRLRVEDDGPGPCVGAESAVAVWVNAPPVAQAGPDRVVAVGEAVRLDASASQDSDGRIERYVWDLGDGREATGARVETAYRQPGRYGVTLEVADDAAVANSLAQDQLLVWVNDPPIADAGPEQWVTASKVQFDGRGSRDPDGRIQDWSWDFGDGAQGQGPTPTHVYAAPGTYQVTLTVTDDSGTSSASARDGTRVRVNARPVADAGPDRLVAPGETIVLDGADSFDPDGAVVGYRWDLGDGTSATGQRVTHAYANPGRYNLGLQVWDDSGHPNAFGAADAVIRVNASPVAVAGPDRRVAPGETVELDAGASHDPDGHALTYRWFLSDRAEPLVGERVSARFDTPGVVTATLEVTDDSGAGNAQALDRLTIRVNHPPTALPDGPLHQCDGPVRLTAEGARDPDGDPLTHAWDVGDGGAPVQGQRVTHRFAGPGRYPVTLRVDDGTGLDNASHAASIEVWIDHPPVAIAEAPDLVCAGDRVLFNGTRSHDPDGGALLHLWEFGDGSTAQGPSPVKSYTRGGDYSVTLSVMDDSGLDCGVGKDRLAVRVVAAPVADAGEDQAVCAGSPVTFDGSASSDFDGVVNSFLWDFGDGEHASGPRPTHIYAEPGEYRARLTVSGDRVGDCDNQHSDEVLVRVLGAPRVAIAAPAEAAVASEIPFTIVPLAGATDGLEPGLSARWDFGDGRSAQGIAVTHAYSQPGRHTVTLNLESPGGGDCRRVLREHSVRVNAPPRAVAGGDREVAVGDRLVLDGSASMDPDGVIQHYHWSFGDGEQADGVQVAHRYAQPGIYDVELTVTDDTQLANNQHRDRLKVKVNAPPSPVPTWSPAVACPGETVAFDGGGSLDRDGRITRWGWRFGDGAEGEGARVRHAYTEPGRYAVTLSVADDSTSSNSTAHITRTIWVNQSPRAAIGTLPKGCPGQPLRFDASRSLDPDGELVGHRWSFGDAGEGEGVVQEHVYATAGRYPVRLLVQDDSGSACGTGEAVTEAVVNSAPKARIEASSRLMHADGAHEAILFDASASSDADGDPLVYLWDFGDGHQGRGPKVAHAFSRPGRYQVRLRVQDDSGTACADGSEEIQIQVDHRQASP